MTILKIDKVAEFLEVSEHTIYKWVHNNDIPFIKLPNGGLRFEQTKIEHWLKSRTVASN